MKNEPTPRQFEALKVIFDFRQKSGQSPTMREVGDQLGISSLQSITDLLYGLQQKDFLNKEKNRPRAIMLTEKGLDLLNSGVWFPVQQPALFDFRHIRSMVASGTQNLQEHSLILNPYTPRAILDNDAASSIYGNETYLLVAKQLPQNQYMLNSAASEYRTQFNELPRNVNTIADPFIFPNSCTLYDSLEEKILMTWQSSNAANFYNGTLNGDNSDFLLRLYNSNLSQLELPFSNFLSFENQKMTKFFKKSIMRISKFCDFPIWGAAITYQQDIYICSHHTANKQADFGAFLTAIQKGWVVISGGDKILLRDLFFNGLSAISLRSLVNNSSTERSLK